MISYAQNCEDVMLRRAFPPEHKGFYIDVGSGDPVELSVTNHFYQSGWRGVNIDPVPKFQARLRELRPEDQNLDCVLGEKEGEVAFFEVAAAGELSTICNEHAVAPNGGQLESDIVHHTVRMRTLADVCEQIQPARDIDFLKIDVEGAELQVIRGADWRRYRPRILIIEAVAPGTTTVTWHDWEPLLLSNGYVAVWFDGLNKFYLREEDSALERFFRIPPGVFDNFMTPYAAQIEAIAAERERELHAKERMIQDLDGHLKQAYADLIAKEKVIMALDAELTRVKG